MDQLRHRIGFSKDYGCARDREDSQKFIYIIILINNTFVDVVI